MKNVLAVLAGLICAVIIFSLFEFVSSFIYPFPKDIDLADTEALKKFMSNLPANVLFLVLTGYAVGSFAGGFVIGKASKSTNKIIPIIAGAILTIAGIINLISIPHPLWFMIINLLIYIPLVLFGHSLSFKKKEHH